VLALACALLSLGVASSAWAEKVSDLKPQGYVSDFAHVIDPESSERITTICTEVDHDAQAQIAVVTINSLDGEPVEDFAVDLFKRWGVGPKGTDRGVLILLAKSDHKLKVEVGYGLEPILPDGMVGGFGRQVVPLLRSGNYGGALLEDTVLIARVIAKDRGVKLGSIPMESQRPARPSPPIDFGLLIFFGIIGFSILLSVIRRARGGPVRRRRGWWTGPPWIGGGFGGGGFGGGGWGGGWIGGRGRLRRVRRWSVGRRRSHHQLVKVAGSPGLKD